MEDAYKLEGKQRELICDHIMEGIASKKYVCEIADVLCQLEFHDDKGNTQTILDLKDALTLISLLRNLQLYLRQILLSSKAIRNNIRVRSVSTIHRNADRKHTMESNRW